MRSAGAERQRAIRRALRRNIEHVDHVAKMSPIEDHILQEAARRSPKQRRNGVSLEILAMADRNKKDPLPQHRPKHW